MSTEFELRQLGENGATSVDPELLLSAADEIDRLRARLAEIEGQADGVLLLGQHVESVTKAILFDDCGSAQDWQDNVSLGKAAIQAYRPAVQAWRNDAIESAAKIAARYGHDDVAAEIRALLSGPLYAVPVPAIPEGWKLMPIEADDAMIDSACNAGNLYRVDAMRVYDTCVAAAPQPEGESK